MDLSCWKTKTWPFELIAFIHKNFITSGDDSTLLKAKGSSTLCINSSANHLLKSKRVHFNGAYVLSKFMDYVMIS